MILISVILIAELSRAQSVRSGTPWVRKFGNLCISENRPYVRPALHVSRNEILHFTHPRVSTINRIASLPFTDKNKNQKRILSFDLLSMSTLTWMTEKELQSRTKLLEKVFPIMSTFIPTKLFPKARHLCGKKSPSPSSMLLPTNAQGTGFLLNTQQHCFQRKGEREQPVQLRCLEKCSPSIQFSQQFCPS